MRRLVSLAVASLLALAATATRAYSPDEKTAGPESIAALEARIRQAQPREQCYLYAELIHEMTEFSLRQYAQGNTDKASQLLLEIQQLAAKLHLSVGDNDKRLKNAQILLRHTAFRLSEMLHSSSYEDRPLVQQTLAQVSKAETEAMLQVFKK